MLKGLIVGLLTTVNGMTFKQFEGKEYFIDTTKVRVAPDGHELHFIQDANDNIFEWDKTTKLYTHHDESKHHNDDGHHHKLIFNFESGSPPEELQKDDQGHKLIEIVNKKDQTRYIWMYEDGNYHDAELDAMQDDPIVQHEMRTGDYVAPKLGYFPYHGPYVTKLLIEAVKIGDYKEVMRLFRTSRVDPNMQDELGNTALHYAHEYAYVQIVCILGTHHADFHILNKFGRTPYDEYEAALDEMRGERWLAVLRETLGDDIIRANYRFSKHSSHEHWEPGAKFVSEDPEEWHHTNGQYHHHIVGQPVGRAEPDKLDL